jgi:tetratricopeptide (TPR) repeat protein
MTTKTWTLSLSGSLSGSAVLLAAALAGAGCGGGSGGGGGGGGGDGTGGGEVVTDGGTVLTAEAENHWTDALTAYNAARTDGWTEAECNSVIAGFDQANSAQGGRFTEAIFMVGRTHDDCGHADQARDFYRRALEMNPEFCGARVAAGNEHYRAGRVAEARAEYERSVRDDTRCTEGYVNLAIVQRRTPAEAADALQNLRRALAIDSSYLPAFNQMALLYYSQAVRSAGSSVSGGVAAVSGSGAAEEEDESDARRRRRAAASSSNRQMLDLAEVVCRQAQLIDGNYAPIYNTWGLINVAQGNIIAALAKFERAFNLQGDFFEAYMNFGELTLSFRGYEDAAAAFTRATELRADTYDAWLGLGAARRGLNNPDEAQAAYERAIAIDATRPEAYYNIGLLWQDYRDGAIPTLNRATEYYNQFVTRAGSRPEYSATLDTVTHRCTIEREGDARARLRARRRRRRAACAMGRLQQIEEAIRTINDIAEMQRMAAEMEAANAEAAAAYAAEAAAAAAAEGVATPPAGGGGATPAPEATPE